MKFFKLLFSEFYLLYFGIICKYPDSYIGSRLRRKFWSKKLKKCGKNIHISMGATIGFPELIEIGDNFFISHYSHITASASEGIFIGNNVSISRGTYFHASNHKFDQKELSISEQGTYSAQLNHNNNIYSIVIEDDVWIGSNCVIQSGTHLSKGCIVASGSVTSSKYDNDSVIGGNPSRLIKKRF